VWPAPGLRSVRSARSDVAVPWSVPRRESDLERRLNLGLVGSARCLFKHPEGDATYPCRVRRVLVMTTAPSLGRRYAR